ncbi:MAG: hypothetical protein FJY56_10030 [Betaproteobacteria bacterium]|nr:hypothetical protein [Betaproteobacteria bacterium]
MAIAPDVVFLRSFKWFKDAVSRLGNQLPSDPPVNLSATLTDILRTRLGLQLNLNNNQVDLEKFQASNAEAESLAVATLVTGETLAALRTLGGVIAAIAGNQAGLADLSKVIKQIDRIVNASVAGKPPSAYSIAKLLLILSGDADAASDDPPALKLIRLLKGNNSLAPNSAELLDAQMMLGLAIIAVGTILDRSFQGAGVQASLPPVAIPLPPAAQRQSFTLLGGGGGANKLDLNLGINTGVETKLFAGLSSALSKSASAGDGFALQLTAGAGFQVQFALPTLPLPPAALPAIPKPEFNGNLDIGLSFGRTTPLVLGNTGGTHFSIGELTGGINLNLNGPQVTFDLKNAKLVLQIGDDALLSAVIGDAIEVSLSFGLIGDTAGIRLKDGSGLKTTIPLAKIPGSPVQIPFLYFDLIKGDGLNSFDIEIAGSFQVAIGPFAGSIDRLGTKLNLANMRGGGANPIASWGLKPPSGAGFSIDAGVIKGGGFLLFDPARGEYGGILDIKLMQIGVKAIGLLSTKNPGGWSLLLIITAQLPPVQLGFGFTMTGIGGLLGVQHTINTEALSSGLSTGSLDSFLFPQDPIAKAPQIINQLRTIFPFSPGGFVIGPMLELGWGTPSLVTARIGVLIEASQIVIVGQVIVQLPPLVEKSLSLLYLQMDIAGGVVFDPLKFWLDGVLRDSRVMFISLTGQFAFRALFGDKPTFLLSAGGFHPKFTDIPPDIPAPFQRVGAEFSIGIVGLRFEGYFAVTSATVQGGSSLRVWGDVGVASFEGGFEFNAIIYLVPRFRFEVDIHVWAGVEVFGIDFASVDIYGMLAGPGRWHLRGTATIHTPWPLPDFDFEVDEKWGEELDTPMRKLKLADELKKELEAADDKGTPVNWSAVLPPANDGFVTLAELPEQPGLLAHPNALLQFLQKRMPLAKTLTKLGSDAIEGEKLIAIGNLTFGAINKSADRKLDDNFPIAQFTDLKEDDLLAKPSFERFESGFEVGQSDYLFGAPVAANFDYEEVNLSTPAPPILGRPGLVSSVLLKSALNMGAAGRSVLRDKAKRLPDTEVKIKVNPPPLQTLDTVGGAMIGNALTGRATQSYWSAMDTAQANAPGAQVVEAFEMSF